MSSPATSTPVSLPLTRSTIAINRTGNYSVIEKITLPLRPHPSDIVVKTEYLGINFLDTVFLLLRLHIRSGAYGQPPFPAELGIEASGTVVALPTDPRVLNNPDYKKRAYTVGSRVALLSQDGVHSDYVALPWDYVHPVPQDVSSKVAGAVLLQGLTALSFVEEAYPVKKGDTVLIHTVAGGTGLMFAQLSKARGATVIGTTSTKEKAEIAKAHGADHVILYKNENTVQRVLELTNGDGVDAVFDGVGKDTFYANFKLLKRKGTFVSLGDASGPVPHISPGMLGQNNLKFIRAAVPNYFVTPDERYHYTTWLWKTVQEGKLKAVVHKEYPFTAQGAQDAHRDLLASKTSGKLLLKVEDN
ncbi:NAD(P)-binding protein [Mycena indigotica]|uniref:Probable quinone oxidoreductase n=1 Tax=Mycena indigotica TaxID=2126181 RepID=A0A8H6SYR0_9AGAR|nr:NAD(P)-binding protein [Mycena indigotica]KAF7307237.1 NAD(P)-binding protein [Mycena indigotica]